MNAVVIGANSGIGKGFVNVLLQKDNRVIEADINFSKESDHKYILDATKDDSLTSFYEKITLKIQYIDYLIITIGSIDEGNMMDYPANHLEWMLNNNCIAPFRIVQTLLPLLKLSQNPKILLTGSLAGMGSFTELSNLGPYIISKHAFMGYFKVLKNEMENLNIQVSLLIPNRIKGNLSTN